LSSTQDARSIEYLVLSAWFRRFVAWWILEINIIYGLTSSKKSALFLTDAIKYMPR